MTSKLNDVTRLEHTAATLYQCSLVHVRLHTQPDVLSHAANSRCDCWSISRVLMTGNMLHSSTSTCVPISE